MNFKPTTWKVIISLLMGVFWGLMVGEVRSYATWGLWEKIMQGVSLKIFLITFAIIFIIVYIICSLINKHLKEMSSWLRWGIVWIFIASYIQFHAMYMGHLGINIFSYIGAFLATRLKYISTPFVVIFSPFKAIITNSLFNFIVRITMSFIVGTFFGYILSKVKEKSYIVRGVVACFFLSILNSTLIFLGYFGIIEKLRYNLDTGYTPGTIYDVYFGTLTTGITNTMAFEQFILKFLGYLIVTTLIFCLIGGGIGWIVRKVKSSQSDTTIK